MVQCPNDSIMAVLHFWKEPWLGEFNVLPYCRDCWERRANADMRRRCVVIDLELVDSFRRFQARLSPQ
jgi:hypothetical protein